MELIKTNLKDVYIIKLSPITDERGSLTRMFCKKEMNAIMKGEEIVQINHTITKEKNTIRGMHYQDFPKSETKIISCIKGEVLDIIIDIRKNSPTFMKRHEEVLSENNQTMLYVPKGFAHGFQTLSDDVGMIYFHTQFYSKEKERGIRYDDPKLGIKWPFKTTNISDKDKKHKLLDESFKGVDI